MKADLHTHTTKSDGMYGVKDLIDHAKCIGLDYIAITDHDTVAGIIEAVSYGKQIGMKVIPGVEFSTKDYESGRAVHVLCYYPGDLWGYQEFLDQTLSVRYDAKYQMCEMLAEDFPVDIDDILEAARDSGSIYNHHMMIPFQKMGYTGSLISDFFQKEAGRKSKRYIRIPYPDVYEALDLIDRCGGIAVIAHPGEYDSLALCEKLAKEGRIKGLEFNHPRNTEADREEIKRIATEYGLFLTGGTDFHGPSTSTVNPLGTYLSPEEGVKAILEYGK